MDEQKIIHPDNPYVKPVNSRSGKVKQALISSNGIRTGYAVLFWILLIAVLGIVLLINASDIPSTKKISTLHSRIAGLTSEIELVNEQLDEATDIAYFGSKAADLGMERPDENNIITLEALSPRP